jgi:hypothetical protein
MSTGAGTMPPRSRTEHDRFYEPFRITATSNFERGAGCYMRANWRTDESTPAAEGQIENLPSAERKFPAAATSPMRDLALEKHYSVYELSQLWGLSEKTIRRLFTDEPGVVKLGTKKAVSNEAT